MHITCYCSKGSERYFAFQVYFKVYCKLYCTLHIDILHFRYTLKFTANFIAHCTQVKITVISLMCPLRLMGLHAPYNLHLLQLIAVTKPTLQVYPIKACQHMQVSWRPG